MGTRDTVARHPSTRFLQPLCSSRMQSVPNSAGCLAHRPRTRPRWYCACRLRTECSRRGQQWGLYRADSSHTQRRRCCASREDTARIQAPPLLDACPVDMECSQCDRQSSLCQQDMGCRHRRCCTDPGDRAGIGSAKRPAQFLEGRLNARFRPSLSRLARRRSRTSNGPGRRSCCRAHKDSRSSRRQLH